MNPFIQSFSGRNHTRLKNTFIALEEKHIIFRCFREQFAFKKMKVGCFLYELLPWLPLLNYKGVLVIALPTDNLGESMVFVLPVEHRCFWNFGVALNWIFYLDLKEIGRVEAFFLRCCRMIPHIVLLAWEYTSGLHGTASFGAQDASNVESPS